MSPVSDSERRESERIGAAIRSAVEGVEAPTGLRSQIVRDGQREPVARRRWIAVPVLGVLLAAVITSVTLLALGSSGGPTLAEAAGLALRAPTQAAPPGDPRDERFLRAEVGGVQFPNYRYSTPFRTAGARSDELHGRHALTVVYGLDDKRIGYTIVDGKPLSGALRSAAGHPRRAAHRDPAPARSGRCDLARGRPHLRAGQPQRQPRAPGGLGRLDLSTLRRWPTQR